MIRRTSNKAVQVIEKLSVWQTIMETIQFQPQVDLSENSQWKEFIQDLSSAESHQQLTTRKQLKTIISYNSKQVVGDLTEKVVIEEKQTFYDKIKVIFAVQNPSSSFRICWELISMVLIFIQMIQIPLMLSYEINDSNSVITMDWVINGFYMIDLVMNFNVAIYERGDLNDDRRRIAQEYLRTWFTPDLISVIPYDLLTDGALSGNYVKVLRFFKFIKILRLLRVLKLKRLFNVLEQIVTISSWIQAVLQFIRLAILILSLAHWIACIWNIIEIQTEAANDTWMRHYGIADAEWEIKYISALYYSITTMITVGYGDISVKSPPEMIFSVFAMIFASAVFGYSMSSIMIIIETEDVAILEMKNNNQKLIKYLKQKKVSKNLLSRVNNYTIWLAGSAQVAKNHELQVLENLSANLRSEITCLLNGRILFSMKILTSSFTNNFMNKLIYLLKEQTQGPEELIIQENVADEGKFYYINNGQVQIVVGSKDLVLRVLQRGDYFGEIGFFGGLARTASAKTIDFVNLMTLQSAEVWKLASDQDLEKLFHMRNNLQIENSFDLLYLNCYICDKPNHIARSCTKIHYKRRKDYIILEYNEQKCQRSIYTGIRMKKYSTLQEYQSLSAMTQYYQQKNITRLMVPIIQYGLEDITKHAFVLDVQKDYNQFYRSYNITEIVQKYNKIADINYKLLFPNFENKRSNRHSFKKLSAPFPSQNNIQASPHLTTEISQISEYYSSGVDHIRYARLRQVRRLRKKIKQRIRSKSCDYERIPIEIVELRRSNLCSIILKLTEQ